MKKTLLFCTGPSGSGKSYFINNFLPAGAFYKLKSATTRPMRENECQGREYYFEDEEYFETTSLVTKLWVNQAVWTPGKPKWLYGVPETEVRRHLDKNLVYDVIEPKYVRQMMDWFAKNEVAQHYELKTLYFIPPENSGTIITNRANMPDDTQVRAQNTCNPIDFLRAGVDVDFMLKCSAQETIVPERLRCYLKRFQHKVK